VPGTAVRRCRFADPDDALLFALKWSWKRIDLFQDIVR
jgi:hypothetical protein